MQLSLVTTESEFRSLRTAWNEMASPTPFQHWEWAYAWWKAFGNDRRQLFILVVRDETEIVGLLPLFAEKTVKHGRTLQFLGSGKACGDYMDLLVRPSVLDQVCLQITTWLISEKADFAWDTINLDGLKQEDSNVEALIRGLYTGGCVVDRRPLVSSWLLQLPACWDDYLSSLSKRTRRTLRSLDREFIASGRARVETTNETAGLLDALPILEDMHGQRRQQIGDSGCYAVEGFRDFVEITSQLVGSSNRLQMRTLYVDDRPVASNLGFVMNDSFFIYQAGFYPTDAKMKPGWILNAMAIQEGLNGAFSQIDFLRGDERYKASLGAKRIPLHRIEIVAPTSSAYLRRSLRITGSTLKQITNWWSDTTQPIQVQPTNQS